MYSLFFFCFVCSKYGKTAMATSAFSSITVQKETKKQLSLIIFSLKIFLITTIHPKLCKIEGTTLLTQ